MNRTCPRRYIDWRYKVQFLHLLAELHDPADKMQLCLSAVGHWVQWIRYVPKNIKTVEFFFEAAKENCMVLEYMPENLKTEQFCVEAVKQNDDVLFHVPEKFFEICREASKTVEKPAETTLCEKTVKNGGLALEYVPGKFKTYEVCLEAVKKSGWALQYVPEKFKTVELCFEAVKETFWALKYVPENLKKGVATSLAQKGEQK